MSSGVHKDQKTLGCSGAEVRGDCDLADMGAERASLHGCRELNLVL